MADIQAIGVQSQDNKNTGNKNGSPYIDRQTDLYGSEETGLKLKW